MSDHDLATDDLEARLATALHRRADRATPSVPSVAQVRAGARRQDHRRRRLQLGAVAAAAVVVAALVVLRPGTDDATYVVGPGPTTVESTTEPIHLLLDDDTLTLTDATEARPTAPTGPDTTRVGGPVSSEHIVYSIEGAIDAPLVSVYVNTSTEPTRPWGPLAINQRSISIGDRPARVLVQTDGPSISLWWDDTHEIFASSLGIDEAGLISALETVEVDDDGRWSLATPPAGLAEVARTLDDDVDGRRGWASDLRYLNAPDVPSSGAISAVRLSTKPLETTDPDQELLVQALQFRSAAGSIERTTIRGHAGYVLTAPRSESMARIVYLWVEPGRGLVTVWFDGDDRARSDHLMASMREAGPEEWASVIRSCTGIVDHGTVALLSEGTLGGPCPQP